MSTPLPTPSTIITAHAMADYDAIAAIVAAGKLYPEATLIAPPLIQRQESNEFIKNLHKKFKLLYPKEVDLSQVKLLIIVDTRKRQRISHIDEILDIPNLEIHLYDHHPPSSKDIIVTKELTRKWGSTTTILLDCIQKKCLHISSEEATLFGLGLYEDTGSFTSPTTTSHDFQAGAYLLSNGMDLQIITELTNGTLTGQQIYILNMFLNNASTHNIHGIPITLIEIILDEYVDNISLIVDHFTEVEKTKVVFVLIVIADKVQIIARSRIKEVDVGKICQSFGGGGHSFSAAASVKQETLSELKSTLMTLLVSSISPQMTVGSKMTSPAKTITEDISIKNAEDIMIRYGLKAIPVLDTFSGECKGILELQTANRATAHELGNLAVTEYMQSNFNVLQPESSLYSAIEIILKERQRLIPIVLSKKVVGVLTRTDLINLLIDDLQIPEGEPHKQKHLETATEKNIKELFSQEIVAILQKAGNLADTLGIKIFAVGGFVRDLVMHHPNFDIDMSVEGDAISFAHSFAKLIKGRVREHQKFRTAIVFYTDNNGEKCHIDLATARLEYYEYPAALPSIELSSIKMDLFRRDFTINALAIQLNQKKFGTLIDPFGGKKDLKNKKISVLHSLSFIEDPTRILRAVRFEQRFEFRISAQTESLIKNSLSLGMLKRLSGARLFNELKHIFNEKNVVKCFDRLNSLGILKEIHPKLELAPAKKDLLASLSDILGLYRYLYKKRTPTLWIYYTLGLCSKLNHEETSEILEIFGFTEKAKTELYHLRKKIKDTSTCMINLRQKGQIPYSKLREILHSLDLEGLLYLMGRYGKKYNIGQDISFYLTKIEDVKADITGKDLINIGYAQGPLVGHILHLLFLAKLDGVVRGRTEQLMIATNYLATAKKFPEQLPQLDDLLNPSNNTNNIN